MNTASPAPASVSDTPPVTLAFTSKLKVIVIALAVVVAAEWIGLVPFTLGPGKITLLPMLWALLIAACWGSFHRYLPAPIRLDRTSQGFAGALLDVAVLLLIVKLGLTVGGNLPALKQAGWALFFQEFGHAFGTLALGLPLALLLGIKREAVGATFSVGRENNIAIISEKYGMQSPEGRGVLAEYITGTVLGAMFIAALAGFISSLDIFDPRSLAMGAGVGSGSLMAAALGAIAANTPEHMIQEVTAIAAASNLLTSVVGFYFTLFLSLPACAWLYTRLEPVIGRLSKRGRQAALLSASAQTTQEPANALPAATLLSLRDAGLAGLVMIIGVSIGSVMSYNTPLSTALPGMLVATTIVAVVRIAKHFIPRLPVLIVLSLLATVVGIPGMSSVTDSILELTSGLNFLAFTTPVLALAGFSVAKDLPLFRQLGWRIIVVSLAATAGTFLGATLIAEFFH